MSKPKENALSQAFRKVAGMEDRKTDAPSDGSKVTRYTEPEGGYGGKDGVSNSNAATTDEQRSRDERDARLDVEADVKAAEAAEEAAAKSGQGTNTAADAKTDPTNQGEDVKVPAKKTAAKKSAAKSKGK